LLKGLYNSSPISAALDHAVGLLAILRQDSARHRIESVSFAAMGSLLEANVVVFWRKQPLFVLYSIA
jgi:hypothetical protein